MPGYLAAGSYFNVLSDFGWYNVILGRSTHAVWLHFFLRGAKVQYVNFPEAIIYSICQTF